ncbi:oxygen-dependent coproporphyrinogen oxidase [Tengunoibacter tsumagoiensis]|uniref:coproporphyrinogen oxidase n=1 Tax=Tengunoibacter tsumagoiensis TaxID=2014871 RepID=A0A401ZZD4_9CHLR|nr:oxygen-dependent coproporphyrinogen oxidase [Tengunoibacter tsumagoiensis]GCE12193.1 oxygen-dependent coproporphyrinogen-III oxidase [Tengunoibacter tsumagoiensis]
MNDDLCSRMEQVILTLQETICQRIEALDHRAHFREDNWRREEGGFGISRVMQDGEIFEKAGVNMSTVWGQLSHEAARQVRLEQAVLDGQKIPFRVTSISLVLHPHNPFVPTSHAHYRYFEYGEGEQAGYYFGGSVDLTPCYLIEEDVVHFHRLHKAVCDHYDPAYYPRFKQACDDYFYLPHRMEYRGVGGLFLGNLSSTNTEELFRLVTECAQTFIPAYFPLVERRKDHPFSEAQKRWQRQRRGRYVEFNLLCDRGTAFGLKTGGRTESILMTLPLSAGWEYDYHPEPGSEEAQMVEILRQPRVWV